MAAITQAEFAKTVQDPLRRGIIETSFEEEPVYGIVPFQTIKGLALPYNQESSLPGVAFRNINEAFTTTAGVINRLVETVKPFGGMSDTDIVLVDGYGSDQRTSRDKLFAKAMSVKYVQTMCYGNSPASRAGTDFDDVSGFDGIQTRVTAAQTIDALGSAGADGSSVFAIRFGDGYAQGLQTPSGVAVKDKGELENGIHLRTVIQHVAGFAIFHGKAIGWIKNLRAATQVLTRVMMDDLGDLIVGKPDAYLMTKRSRAQLKTSVWGAGGPGAGAGLNVMMDQLGNMVESWGGVPIYVSDAMINTETNG